MGDQVRIAADRRREVRVGRAAEPGVAEVLVRVVGLLERAQDERAERLGALAAPARLARDPAADLADQVAGLGRAHALLRARRGHLDRRELVQQAVDARRVGLLVDAIERGRLSLLEQVGHLLVREDHQVLDQLVGLGLRDAVCADDRSVGVELELRLERLHLERAARAPLGQRSRCLARQLERLGDQLGRRARGRRRSGRAGRSRGGRRSGCGCGRSSPSAPCPAPSSRTSAVTARRSWSGTRLHASFESAPGSIGSTIPGT